MAHSLLLLTCGDTGTRSGTLCDMHETEAPALVFRVPSRWDWAQRTHSEAVQEVDRCAQILARGVEALSGLYLRICDTIRWHRFTDNEIRAVLSKYFPRQRVSEFIIIAHAPQEVYNRYKLGLIGFRATLKECRYRLHSDDWLKQRRIRHAAERLIALLGPGEVEVCGHRIVVF